MITTVKLATNVWYVNGPIGEKVFYNTTEKQACQMYRSEMQAYMIEW